ncbi:toxin glutamine deamidase domain-containing protein [Streptomyces sp. NBC_01304]|uniref:toxin glutamine deamidase domain-containing protein n=1 Tax=Streptomyces sp. NBC_01304 TaxID=2903818 RepID=UPI002E1640F1|nr:toxin glutamine deamidase domain-containing protein [Streptomyces sp. NBC_01304]
MRRAKYATASSAAAKKYRQALDEGDVDYGGPAWRAQQRAQEAADHARAAAEAGDHDGAERAALDAKNAMNHAAQLSQRHTQSAKAKAAAARRTNKQVDKALDEANPKYQAHVWEYSHNCSHVAQAYELRRRGLDVEAGPDSTKGRNVGELGEAWGGHFTHCDTTSDTGRSQIERAFGEPGSRGMVAVWWKNGGGHAFTVENVDGKVRFVDGQPNPPVTDASEYFARANSSAYMRLDDKPTPSKKTLEPFIAA